MDLELVDDKLPDRHDCPEIKSNVLEIENESRKVFAMPADFG